MVSEPINGVYNSTAELYRQFSALPAGIKGVIRDCRPVKAVVFYDR